MRLCAGAAGRRRKAGPVTPGDRITIRLRETTLGPLPAIVTAIDLPGRILRYRYADDAPIFAGLVGVVRLSAAEARALGAPPAKRGQAEEGERRGPSMGGRARMLAPLAFVRAIR